MSNSIRSLFASAALGITVGIGPVIAQPIPKGAALLTITAEGEPMTVYTYRPACAEPSLLMVFHGLGRNAAGYRDYARKVADDSCRLVVAPFFDVARFPVWRYQHGGLTRKGEVQDQRNWTGQLVLQLIEEVRKLEGRRMPYALIGHSGGAQFLMRFAASARHEAQRIVVANPGTLVWASATAKAPYGLGGLPDNTGSDGVLRRYLAQPLTIYLGQDDTELEDLSQAREARKQGADRLERGRNVYAAALETARTTSLPIAWRLVEAPGTGHSARRMFNRPELSEALKP